MRDAQVVLWRMSASVPAPSNAAVAPIEKLIDSRVQIEGAFPVEFGHGTVVHPHVTIMAKNGPISIGEYCIIDEACLLENRLHPDASGAPRRMIIGDFAVLGTRCDVFAASVGTGCRLEPRAHLGIGAVLEDGVTVKARCRVSSDTVVPTGTVVYGADSAWRVEVRNPLSEESYARNCTRFFRRNAARRASAAPRVPVDSNPKS